MGVARKLEYKTVIGEMRERKGKTERLPRGALGLFGYFVLNLYLIFAV